MAKQIACPNCGAPASIQPFVREQKCEWCNSAFVLNDHGASLLGGGSAATAALEAKHTEADLRAHYRRAIDALEAHSKAPSFSPAAELPRWLRWTLGLFRSLGWILAALALAAIVAAGALWGEKAVALVVFYTFLLGWGGSVAIRRSITGPVNKATALVPSSDWLLTQLRFALEAERAADLVGVTFDWPTELARTPVAITTKCEAEERRRNEAVATLCRELKSTIATMVALFMLLTAASLYAALADYS